MLVFLLVAASAFGVACLMTYLLSRPGSRFLILDLPNERSLHSTPISRAGGLAIWAGGLAGVIVATGLLDARSEFLWIAIAALLVGVVSFVDDRSHLPVGLRMTVHVAAAALLLVGGLDLLSIRLPGAALGLPPLIGVPLSLLFIIWMTNLYNFMDGMDGFAGGMAVFGFGTLGLLAHMGGDAYFAAVCWAIAAAAGGFLVWNFPPARVFMGDTGASVLGLTAAALSLLGDRLGLFPLWIALLVFSPFILDATVTLIQRASRRERIWQAHRSHYYQRLVQLGWGHKKTVLAEYVLMAGCAVTAIGLSLASPEVQWMGVAAWAAVYAVALSAVDFQCKKRESAGKRRDRRSDAT